ncbi:MAG TPA: GDP-mannose mannosyl hydrolase [Bacteroidales bacterium]|nr:GDP-mannose mannosyl hydrolase [Bacteroidales bacterium]
MESTSFLSREDFTGVIRNSPLIAIDLIVKNSRGEVLLGFRNNSPARNTWFVPGGRIRKNETIEKAFQRITGDELGQVLQLTDSQFYGIFEHFYPGENTFDEPGLDTHYINLAYEIRNFDETNLNLRHQHTGFRWMTVEQVLTDRGVHQNARLYFK